MKQDNGWSFRRIDELGEIQAGRQRAPQYKYGKLRPYLRVANVFDGYIRADDVLEMAFSDEEFEQYRLSPGDVLLNEGQSLELVGRSAVYSGTPPNCCFQNTLIRFRPGKDIDGSFAQLLFQFLQYRGVFSRVALQTTSIAHLGVSRFGAIKVSLPPLDQQRLISGYLSHWTRASELLSRQIDARTLLKSGLLHRLLSPATAPPNSQSRAWKSYHLGDLFSERNETGRLDLRLLSITADRGIIPRTEIDRKDSSSYDKRAYKRIARGDIGYNTMRMWQGVSAHSDLEGVVSPAYTICVPTNHIIGEFAAYLFKYPPVINLFRRYSQGLVDDTLVLKFPNFAKIRISIPEVEQQVRIAHLLQLADKQMELLRDYSRKIFRQKKELMREMLSGEICVPTVQAGVATRPASGAPVRAQRFSVGRRR